MVFPLLKHMLLYGLLAEAHWVSLNPTGPPLVNTERIQCHHVSLEGNRLAGYGKAKEVMWGAIHGTGGEPSVASDLFWSEDFSEYAYYNRLCAELIRKLDEKHDFDVFYVHDFQQLPLGRMLGTLKPKIYRWHIPFDESRIPEEWGEPLATYLNSYDLMIVSSEGYLASLKEFGFTGRIEKLYPFVDPADYTRPSKEEAAAVSRKLGISPRDRVVLVVARMDPMKGQDRAISAFAAIAAKHPRLKLALVGNGSFSGSKQGVGLSKSTAWREELERLSARFGVRDRVIFTGHLTQRELDAMYERSAFTVLPSVKEGFGLVVIESWIHNRAPIVTARAGVAELIEDGRNGLLFDPDDPQALPERMERLLGDRSLARQIARRGSTTSKRCSLKNGLRAEAEVIHRLAGG